MIEKENAMGLFDPKFYKNFMKGVEKEETI